MQIELANSDGKERKQLTREQDGEIAQFTWCSETQIAYIVPISPLGNSVQKLVYENVDGSERKETPIANSLLTCPGKKSTTIATKNMEEHRALAFGPLSAGGKQVVFTPRPEPSQAGYAVWIENAEGTERKKLLEDPSATVSVTPAPDGSVVFIATHKHGRYSEIFRINADGSGLKKIISGKPEGLSYSSPMFSPDGRLMVVIAGNCVQCEAAWFPSSWKFSVLLIDLDAGHQKRLANETNVEYITGADVVWGPK